MSIENPLSRLDHSDLMKNDKPKSSPYQPANFEVWDQAKLDDEKSAENFLSDNGFEWEDDWQFGKLWQTNNSEWENDGVSYAYLFDDLITVAGRAAGRVFKKYVGREKKQEQKKREEQKRKENRERRENEKNSRERQSSRGYSH